jgi:hypothetical protein
MIETGNIPNESNADSKQSQRFVPNDWATLSIPLGIIGSVIVFVLGAIGSVVLFFYHWSSDISTRDFEARKPFSQVQLETYAKILPITAKINRLWSDRDNAESKAAYSSAVDDFRDLYWGVLTMVEARNVEKAMVIFGRSIHADKIKPDSACAKAKADIALALDHCARDSVSASFRLKINENDYCTPKDLDDLWKICDDVPNLPP